MHFVYEECKFQSLDILLAVVDITDLVNPFVIGTVPSLLAIPQRMIPSS